MSLKDKLQALRLKIGKSILDHTTRTPMHFNCKKILFLRQDGKVGDYIVSSFVFREIKKYNPEIKIGVVCTKKDEYLLKKNSYIDELYFVKRRSILDYIKIGLKIRKEEYDVVIDPTIVIKNRDLFLLRVISAKNYIGYKKSDYKIFNLNIEKDMHFSKVYRAALGTIGISNVNDTYDIPKDDESSLEILNFIKNKNIKDYIAINFFGAARIKKVTEDNIRLYLEYLTEIVPHKHFVLLSYPEVTPMLKKLAKNYENIFLHDTKTIFHTIELIRHSIQLISTDTSTVHIAAGFNKPIIAIYKKDPVAFTHWNPNCKNETHILFYNENINELSPEEIRPEWLNKN